MKREPIFLATPDQVALARAWHGGQASMLYAVSSCGALTLGTSMPIYCETEAGWERDLVGRLRAEVADVVSTAQRQARQLRAEDDPEADDYADDSRIAYRWLNKLDAWLASHPA